MNDQLRPFKDATHHVMRIRRRSVVEWMGCAIWVVVLVVLFEYTISSISEIEYQAGVLAGALFFGILAAGIVVQGMRGAQARSPYRIDRMSAKPDLHTRVSELKERADDSHD